jgi:pantoate--beta-alanine ligase
MKVCRSEVELRQVLRDAGGPVGFVPTMGALHEGHLSLVRRAREEADLVVMSIFVNPLQFGVGEDLAAYPRDERRDLDLAETEKVDIVFMPSVEEMYPPGNEMRVRAGALGDILEGASRPGHFDGVATVVAKLFNVVDPDLAFFGQKDAQQVAVIRRLIEGLSFRTRLIVCPTVREPDGLALSSRNVYLSPEERTRALALWTSLQAAAEALRSGDDPTAAAAKGLDFLAAQEGVLPDYLEPVNPATFERPQAGEDTLFVVAAKVGTTRLIDNLLVQRPQQPESTEEI